MSAAPFRAAHAVGQDWSSVASTLAGHLGPRDPAYTLGFLYLTEELGRDARNILAFLKDITGVDAWVGAVGAGICGTGTELFGERAASALLAPLDPADFRVIDAAGAGAAFPAERGVTLAVVHGDPANRDIPDIVAGFAEETSAFLVGGLTAVQPDAQLARTVAGGGLSGVLLAPGLGIATGLSQGCAPIGPAHIITDGRANVLVELDRRPALDVFIEEIGPELAVDLERAGRLVQVALPVPGADRGDYLVRNLTAIDPDRGLIAIGELIDTGQTLTFCTRSPATAMEDLRRMLRDLRGRLGAPPRGGLYFSCVARGPHLFGPGSRELALIAEELGEFPLAGFYASGEIFNHRLYGYTGVLAVFP